MRMEKDIDKIINEINDRLIEIGKGINTIELQESFDYLISNGGKRFRPLITALSCAVFSGDILKAINQGTAIELLHNFTLVHDDIMDKSPLRRGKETIYQKWNATTAILLGDLILGFAYERLILDLEPNIANEVYKVFTSGLIEVCQGQGFDLEFENKRNINIQEYEMMIEKKTSSLIKTSLLLGGIVGNANKIELEKLSYLGSELGKVFQLQDDLLDITGVSEDFGKKIGQDIIKGKKTYLIIKANEKASKIEHIQLLEKFFENSGLEEKDVKLMKSLFDELGILSELQSKINEKFESIFKIIKDLRDNAHSDLLIDLLIKYSKRDV